MPASIRRCGFSAYTAVYPLTISPTRTRELSGLKQIVGTKLAGGIGESSGVGFGLAPSTTSEMSPVSAPAIMARPFEVAIPNHLPSGLKMTVTTKPSSGAICTDGYYPFATSQTSAPRMDATASLWPSGLNIRLVGRYACDSSRFGPSTHIPDMNNFVHAKGDKLSVRAENDRPSISSLWVNAKLPGRYSDPKADTAGSRLWRLSKCPSI